MESITVDIFGEKYTVKSPEDPSYIKDVALFIDGKMRDIAKGGKVITTEKVAILATLNIVDEFFKSREEWRQREEAATRKLEELVSTLEKSLSQ